MTPNQLKKFLEEEHVTDSAKRLLGCEIVAPDCRIRIVETEAYGGSDDPNSHAHHGLTKRNKVMFETSGCAYVYLNYGVHWLFNITCRPIGEPGAVLIRGAIPIAGRKIIQERRPKARTDKDLLSGPGKIGAALAVTGDHTFTNLLDNKSTHHIIASKLESPYIAGHRIGLRDGSDHRHWRFIDEEFREWASSPKL